MAAGQAGALRDRWPAADVVTLALAGDVDQIASQGKLVPVNWKAGCRTTAHRTRRPSCSGSQGNPKGVKDWAIS